jgi:hypothetical protein
MSNPFPQLLSYNYFMLKIIFDITESPSCWWFFFNFFLFQLEVNFDTERAAVIGHGNVAVDVARILLTPIDLLKVQYIYFFNNFNKMSFSYLVQWNLSIPVKPCNIVVPVPSHNLDFQCHNVVDCLSWDTKIVLFYRYFHTYIFFLSILLFSL